MRTKFIETGDALDGKTVVDLPPNPYVMLLLRLFGTTDTGQTLAAADIGSLRIERNGEQIQSESFEFYHDYNDLKKGFPATFSGSAATAEDVVALVPFWTTGLPNILDVRSKEEVDVTLDFDDTTLATRFGANSFTYELYGIVEPSLFERYVLDIRQQDVNRGAAGRFQEVLDRKNIAALYFVDASDVVDEIQIQTDDQTVWDNIDQDIITVLTNLFNNIESAGNTLGEFNYIETGDIREGFNDKTVINFEFNASGTINVTIFSLVRTAIRNLSRRRASQHLAQRQASLAGVDFFNENG